MPLNVLIGRIFFKLKNILPPLFLSPRRGWAGGWRDMGSGGRPVGRGGMAQRVGTRRLQRIIAARIDPRTLPVPQQLEVARGMLRLLRAPGWTPKQARPRCQARCRDGHPCQARAVWDEDRDAPRNGRCRMHGGVSTGPTRLAGRQRISASNTRRAQRTRLAQAQAARAPVPPPLPVLTQEQVAALAAYRHARAYAKLTRWTASGTEARRARERCLRCGVDPDLAPGERQGACRSS